MNFNNFGINKMYIELLWYIKKILVLYIFFFTCHSQDVRCHKLATEIYRRKTSAQRWYGVKTILTSSDHPFL